MREREKSTYSLTSKYDVTSWCSIALSFCCLCTFTGISIAFSAYSSKSSDIQTKYDGAQIQESVDVKYILAMMASPKTKHSFTQFFIELYGNSSLDEMYAIDAEVLCQWGNIPTTLISRNLPEARVGLNRIYGTGLYSYDSMLAQIHIKGNITKLQRITVTVVNSKPDFYSLTSTLRYYFASLSLGALFLFLIALVVSKEEKTSEHALAICSLVMSAIANYPDILDRLPSSQVADYSCDVLFSGFFQSANVVILYCLVLKATGSSNIIFPLIVSSLFIVADGFAELTRDSTILWSYFDNNTIISVFFQSVSIVYKLALLALTLGAIGMQVYKTRLRTRIVFVFFSLLLFIELVPVIMQLVSYLMTGFISSAVDFFGKYISQEIASMALADMYWPAPRERRPIPPDGGIEGVELSDVDL